MTDIETAGDADAIEEYRNRIPSAEARQTFFREKYIRHGQFVRHRPSSMDEYTAPERRPTEVPGSGWTDYVERDFIDQAIYASQPGCMEPRAFAGMRRRPSRRQPEDGVREFRQTAWCL